jgi:hypothetical protein
MFSIRMIRPAFTAAKFLPARNFVNVGDEVKINFLKGEIIEIRFSFVQLLAKNCRFKTSVD